MDNLYTPQNKQYFEKIKNNKVGDIVELKLFNYKTCKFENIKCLIKQKEPLLLQKIETIRTLDIEVKINE